MNLLMITPVAHSVCNLNFLFMFPIFSHLLAITFSYCFLSDFGEYSLSSIFWAFFTFFIPIIPHFVVISTPQVDLIQPNPSSSPPWYIINAATHAITRENPALNNGHFHELVSLLMAVNVARQGM